MSAHSKETAIILRKYFGRTQRDAEWLANSASLGITPRTHEDVRDLALAERAASILLAEAQNG